MLATAEVLVGNYSGQKVIMNAYWPELWKYY